MLLDEVFLDRVYLDSLEKLAVREGWIAREYDTNEIRSQYFWPRESERIKHKSKVLLLLMLFEHLDSSFSPFSFDKFKRCGIVRHDALISYREYNDTFDDFLDGITEDKKMMIDAHRNTGEILRRSKQKVVRHIIEIESKGFYIHSSKTRVNETDLNNEYLAAIDWFLDHDDLNELSSEKPHLDNYHTNISIIWSSLRLGIYQASKKNTSVATVFPSNQSRPYKNTEKTIDDLYYLVSTRLTDEILVLPKPRCIDEAIEFRERKEMQRFREVLSEWLVSLNTSDSHVENKIRNDLRKANRSLKAVKHWQEYQSSPLNFWLNSIGGQIPVLSNIITAINTVGTLSARYSEKKSNWVALVNT